MEFIEETLNQNQQLRTHLERSAEALLTFQEKVIEDYNTIYKLRKEISDYKKRGLGPVSASTSLEKIPIIDNKDKEKVGSGSREDSSTSSPNISPRSRLLEKVQGDGGTNGSPRQITKHSRHQSITSPLASPRKREWMQCRSCNCPNFRAQPAASWVCSCGHMNVNHVNFLF